VLLKFSGVPLGEACSIVLRGATEQIIGNRIMYLAYGTVPYISNAF
jgi:hypothetical protein